MVMFKSLKLLESPFQGDFILTRIQMQLVPFAGSKMHSTFQILRVRDI